MGRLLDAEMDGDAADVRKFAVRVLRNGTNAGECIVEASHSADDQCALSVAFDGRTYRGVASDYFEALRAVRLQLEPAGLRLYCYGASRQCYPSGMARDMAKGACVYRVEKGRAAKMGDLVDLFAAGRDVDPASVAEQDAFYRAWLDSLESSKGGVRMSVFEMLFPRVADNHYAGLRLGLWLFGLMLLKIPMGLNVIFNAPQVARTADGIPVDAFAPSAAAAFSFVFAAWGLGQFVLGLLALIVLLRYRSLVPLAFLILLIEQAGRMSLRFRWPVERLAAPGAAINIALIGIMIFGLVCSLWRRRTTSSA